MKALISPLEQRERGVRVAQVEQEEFPVAPPLFWVDCDDTVHADMIYVDEVFVEPAPEPFSGQIPATEL
jgi:hypothetical protein